MKDQKQIKNFNPINRARHPVERWGRALAATTDREILKRLNDLNIEFYFFKFRRSF